MKYNKSIISSPHRLLKSKTKNSGKRINFLMNSLDIDTEECIIFPYVTKNSYGKVYFQGKERIASRVSLCLSDGSDIDREEFCLHKPLICHNPSCINPKHLYWGTAKDNSNDMRIDGTSNQGERNPMSKLSDAEVLAIISDGRNYREVADDYKTSKSYVSNLKNGHSRSYLQSSSVRKYSHKLNHAKAISILTDGGSVKEISEKFSVSEATVYLILQGKIWRDAYFEVKSSCKSTSMYKRNLTDEEVIDILTSNETECELMSRYNISKKYLRKIISGKARLSAYKKFQEFSCNNNG